MTTPTAPLQPPPVADWPLSMMATGWLANWRSPGGSISYSVVRFRERAYAEFVARHFLEAEVLSETRFWKSPRMQFRFAVEPPARTTMSEIRNNIQRRIDRDRKRLAPELFRIGGCAFSISACAEGELERAGLFYQRDSPTFGSKVRTMTHTEAGEAWQAAAKGYIERAKKLPEDEPPSLDTLAELGPFILCRKRSLRLLAQAIAANDLLEDPRALAAAPPLLGTFLAAVRPAMAVTATADERRAEFLRCAHLACRTVTRVSQMKTVTD